MNAADTALLVRGLAIKRMVIPGNVAGWELAATQQQAAAALTNIGKGWKVAIRVQGVSKAVDIRAIRPGKPGFVYVGGTEFKVADFNQDVASRLVSISLAEL
jgi:hypothetical protein